MTALIGIGIAHVENESFAFAHDVARFGDIDPAEAGCLCHDLVLSLSRNALQP
jgi:hypothetical protein